MGLTELGYTTLLGNFAKCVKSANIICSDGIQIINCSLLCQPQVKQSSIIVIIDVSNDRCLQAGVIDNKTVFKSYALSGADGIIYQGVLNNETKPANAGMLIKIQLTLGDM